MATSRRSGGRSAAKATAAAVGKSAKAAVATKRVKPATGKPARRKSRAAGKGNSIKAAAMISLDAQDTPSEDAIIGPLIEVRRIHRRDINRVWEFLKRSFREVNSETVEYQRPRSKHRFEEIYEEEGVQQLLFEVDDAIVAYAECTYEVTGSDNWINPRYFEKRDMRPMFIDELAVHPAWSGRGVGSFVLEQLHHLARVNGLTHLVLEVAENNEHALAWYKKRSFRKLDAAIFMACALDLEPDLLPPRALPVANAAASDEANDAASE
jgi:ribosomal protein S18 acetylase RimI-like enzyme